MTRLKIILDDLTDDEADALAQMCRRMIWNDFDRLSANAAERDAITPRSNCGGRLPRRELRCGESDHPLARQRGSFEKMSGKRKCQTETRNIMSTAARPMVDPFQLRLPQRERTRDARLPALAADGLRLRPIL
jgi:hypothetical protein